MPVICRLRRDRLATIALPAEPNHYIFESILCTYRAGFQPELSWGINCVLSAHIVYLDLLVNGHYAFPSAVQLWFVGRRLLMRFILDYRYSDRENRAPVMLSRV